MEKEKSLIENKIDYYQKMIIVTHKQIDNLKKDLREYQEYLDAYLQDEER